MIAGLDKAPAEAVEPPQSASEDADAAPETAPGESPGESDPAETPSVAMPRSWQKELAERWDALTPELQSEILRIEQTREREFRKQQTEAAEHTKAVQAARQQAEQVKGQYEQAIPQLYQAMYAKMAGDFADIRTPEDVTALATNDPHRYLQFDARQKELAAVQQQVQAQQYQQNQQRQQWWQNYVKEQDTRFIESAPEFKDAAKAPKIQSQVRSYLKEQGLSEQEVKALWDGNPLFRDARTQKIIYDAARYRAAQDAVAKAVPKNLPPVQRPGTAQTKSERAQADTQALRQRLKQTGSVKDAGALIAALSRR